MDSLQRAEPRPAGQIAHGYEQDVFRYFAATPKWFELFVPAMNGTYSHTHASLMADYPWNAFPEGTTIVDIGGGEGSLGMALAKAFPRLKVVSQDRPEVQIPAENSWKVHIPEIVLEGRIAFEPYDFFTPQLRTGEQYVYTMRCVIHDWPYPECVAILTNLKSTMLPSSRLLIIEHVILPPTTPAFHTSLALASINNEDPFRKAETPWPLPYGSQTVELNHDYEMLCNWKAKERTPMEWESLLRDVGMKIVKIWPTRTPFSIVEIGLA